MSGTAGENGGSGEEDSDDSYLSLKGRRFKNQTDLDEFREKWQQELKTLRGSDDAEEDECNESENKAKILFLQATEEESNGNVFEAMRLYRKAVQIVPDIEFKMYRSTNSPTTTSKNPRADVIKTNDAQEASITEKDNNENLDGVDLIQRFRVALEANDRMIEKSMDKSVITSGAHFSDLPTEIIFYILRWVVSNELDINSLEKCAVVCKGLYLCSRDDTLWRQACAKVWGLNLGTLNASSYLSWRQMFYEKTRVLYSGCYISKTSYLRYGENSFQDQFYRPVQLVEYYRYFRFFSDGQILVMTTADEPKQSVGKLKNTNIHRHDILHGHYRLHNSGVVIVLKRIKAQHRYDYVNRNRNHGYDSSESITDTYYMEMNIVSTSKRRFCQLQWKNYSIIQMKNKNEITTDFDLTSTKYPPLWFSRVKSYHMEAEAPLK